MKSQNSGVTERPLMASFPRGSRNLRSERPVTRLSSNVTCSLPSGAPEVLSFYIDILSDDLTVEDRSGLDQALQEAGMYSGGTVGAT